MLSWRAWALGLVVLATGCSGCRKPAPAGVAHVAPSTAPAPPPAPSTTSVPAPPSVYPAAEWAKIDDPAAAGWSKAGLETVRARLESTQVAGFMAVVGGRTLFTYGNIRTAYRVASMRKSIVSILYGIHAARGEIHLDKTLAELGIDDVGGLSAQEKEATTRDLLSARSGIYHEAVNPGDDHDVAPARNSKKHGTFFLYNNWDFNALGTIFEKETHTNVQEAFITDLAVPLGMEDYNRKREHPKQNPAVSVHPAYMFHLSTRDLARVGYLMLRGGVWNDKELVPRAWVRESTSAITPVGEMNPSHRRSQRFGYGYLWWVWDGKYEKGYYRGAFTARGHGGQHLTVIPELDLVVSEEVKVDDGEWVTNFFSTLDMLVKAKCARSPCADY